MNRTPIVAVSLTLPFLSLATPSLAQNEPRPPALGMGECSWEDGRVVCGDMYEPRRDSRTGSSFPDSTNSPQSGHKTSTSGDSETDTDGFPLISTRAFMKPHNIPPVKLSAYGILAFPSNPEMTNQDRAVMMCRAYLASLPRSIDSSAPLKEQMVTVWPLEENKKTEALLNQKQFDHAKMCHIATSNYHFPTALTAIKQAQRTEKNIAGRGPFLLAWAPPGHKGKESAVVLKYDLSNVESFQQAEEMLRSWRERIEDDQSLWANGWNIAKIKRKLSNFADRYGDEVMKALGI